LSIIKNKGIQKIFYEEHQIPTAPFDVANSAEEWDAILEKLEIDGTFVIKTCEGGYDGKGVQIAHISELEKYKFIYSDVPVVIEKAIDFVKELSVIVGRDIHGNMNHFEVVEMVFDPVLNLVDTLISPAEVTNEVKAQAITISKQVVEKFGDAGIYAVELFLDANNHIYVNEIAPRPHNSGHHTIESCVTSQFEQLNRILMGWKLGNTLQIRPAAMINLIGPQELNGAYKLAFTEELMSIDEVYIHLYGKTQTRPGRKLGHITLMAETMEELKEKISEVKKLISFV
ncbi:MAG: ATP-grasp domain-containing protein, partial [Bacteroidetes bacterium]|nr:ATP-grasp domain-containing protein [Bacteroidota bacterium]